jgi:hypothetical protein
MNMSGVPKYTVNNGASPPWPSRGVGKGYAIAYPEFLRGPYSVFWKKNGNDFLSMVSTQN